MALTAYPFDSQDITEAQYGALYGAVALSGVVGAPASNHFKVTATGSNLTLTVTAVSGESYAIVRGHALLMTANEALTVVAGEAGARVDRVVLKLDYTNNTITPAIKKGTSGSATPPAIVWGTAGIYEVSLATVAVAAGAATVSNANITDDRQFTGRTVGVWTTATRPANVPVFGYNSTLAVWEASSGNGTWTALPTGWSDLAGKPTTFAPAAHTLDSHTGTLSVSKGGTGATTALAALQALGIYPQASQPATPGAGVMRIWIKTV